MDIVVKKNNKEVFRGDLIKFLEQYGFNDLLQNECVKLSKYRTVYFDIKTHGELKGNWIIRRL